MTQRSRRHALVCLVHIERCGGTSLHRIMQNNWPSYVPLTPFRWPHDPGNVFTPQEATILLRLMPWCAGFGGHSTRSYLRYDDAIGRDVRYVTFVRDPVQRYLSHFNHQVQRVGAAWTMESFLADSRFDNFMTRRLSSTGDLEEAKTRMEKDFTFVGLADEFDASLLLMREALRAPDMKLTYTRQNAAVNADYDQLRMVAGLEDRVLERNLLDLELYAHARTLFERRRHQFRGDLPAAVGSLRASNRNYREDGARRLGSRATRLAWRLPELALRRLYHPDEDLRTSAIVPFRKRRVGRNP